MPCKELEDVMPTVLGQLVPGVSFPLHVPLSKNEGQIRGSSRTISENNEVKESFHMVRN